MESLLLKLQEIFALSKEQLWLLSGVDIDYYRTPQEIQSEARKKNIFNEDKEYFVAFYERKQELIKLTDRGILNMKKFGAYHNSNFLEENWAISDNMLKYLEPVCPISNPDNSHYV